MFTSKRPSKTVTAAVVALLPGLLYSGLSQASCAGELEKLKTAASAYKQAATGKWPLPDKIKRLVREQYEGKFEGGLIYKFEKDKCLATKLNQSVHGGWEQTCLEYQQIASELDKWTKTKGFENQKEAYDAYRAWNRRWAVAQTECDWWAHPEEDKIYALKKKGLVPSEQN